MIGLVALAMTACSKKGPEAQMKASAEKLADCSSVDELTKEVDAIAELCSNLTAEQKKDEAIQKALGEWSEAAGKAMEKVGDSMSDDEKMVLGFKVLGIAFSLADTDALNESLSELDNAGEELEEATEELDEALGELDELLEDTDEVAEEEVVEEAA